MLADQAWSHACVLGSKAQDINIMKHMLGDLLTATVPQLPAAPCAWP